MRLALVITLLVACGGQDAATPDAPPYDPAGTWAFANTYESNTCGLSGVMSDAVLITGAPSVGYLAGVANEQLQPGWMFTCGPSACFTSFAFAWNAGTVFHYREYSINFSGSMAIGGGKETVEQGGTGGCVANFTTAGAK